MSVFTLYKLLPKFIRNIPAVDKWLTAKAEQELNEVKQEVIKKKWETVRLQDELKELKRDKGKIN